MSQRSLHWLVLFVLLLFLSWDVTHSQDTEIPPTADSTQAFDVVATETPFLTETVSPTIEPSPTDVPTLPPTATPPEVTAETTEVVPTPAETATSEPGITPTLALPPEPAQILAAREDFEGNWTRTDWALFAEETGNHAVQAAAEAQALTLPLPTTQGAVQVRVWLQAGAVALSLTDGVTDYRAQLDAQGNLTLRRGDTVLQSARWLAWTPDNWHTVRLSAYNGALRLSLDGVEHLTALDTVPLALTEAQLLPLPGDTPARLRADDFEVYVPEGTPLPTATAFPAPTLPATLTPTTPPELGAQAVTCPPSGEVAMVSVDNAGTPFQTSQSLLTRPSDDGRYVVFFTSTALLPEDTASESDIYLYDRTTCQIQLVSLRGSEYLPVSGVSNYPSISADGRFVVWTHNSALYLRDMTTGNMSLLLTSALGDFTHAQISTDGHYVAIASEGVIIAGDTNNKKDVYRYDRWTGTWELASRTHISDVTNGHSAWASEGFEMSSNGRFIVFESDATNIMPNDTNGKMDVFLRDMQVGTTQLVSQSLSGTTSNGTSTEGDVSDDGRYVVFRSNATDLMAPISTTNEFLNDSGADDDVFLRDMQTGTVELINVQDLTNHASYGGFRPKISRDGRYVTFSSNSNVLAGSFSGSMGGPQIYVRDRQLGRTSLVARSATGTQSNGTTDFSDISRSGSYVTFVELFGTNLVVGDTTVGSTNFFLAAIPTPAPFLYAPTNFTINQTSETSVGLTWTNVAADATKIKIWWNPQPKPEGYYREYTNLTTTNDSITNLTCGQTTHYYIQTQRVTGNLTSYSAFTHAEHYQECLPLNPVGTLTVNEQYATSRTISWVSVDNTTGTVDYRIERSTDGVNFTEIKTQSGTTFTDTALACGTTYYYRVRIHRTNDDQYGGYSPVAQTTTTPCYSCPPPNQPSLVSVGNDGRPAVGQNQGQMSISNDGRYIVYRSAANHIVGGDTNTYNDIFLYDRQTCQNTLVSTNSSNVVTDAVSGAAVISGDGRYIAFCSNATNLVAGDTNGKRDVFLRDTVTGTTERVSLTYQGQQLNDDSCSGYEALGISGDGRYIAFWSKSAIAVAGDSNSVADWFVRDRVAGTTVLISQSTTGTLSNSGSYGSAWDGVDFSDDGRYVVFGSYANTLVANDTNGSADVFRRDLQTGTTELVSVGWNGAIGSSTSEEPEISADGRYVVFTSSATNLVNDGYTSTIDHVYLRDMQTGVTERISVADMSGDIGSAYGGHPSISADGRYVAFEARSEIAGLSGDSDPQIFVRDRVAGRTMRISNRTDGSVGPGYYYSPQISGDGTKIVFYDSTNLSLAAPYKVNDYYNVFVAPLGTPVPLVNPPSNVTAESLTTSSLRVKWTDNAADESGYSLQSSTSSTWANPTTYTLSADVSQKDLTYLTCGQTYYIRVRAERSADNRKSAWATANVYLSCTPPPAPPTGLTAKSTSPSSITLTWTDMADETAYRLERSSSSSDWTEIAVLDANIITYIDNVNVVCGMTYQYRIRAVRSAVMSEYSAAVSGTALTCPVPAAPALVAPASAAFLNTPAPALSWGSTANAGAYEVQIASDSLFAVLIQSGMSTHPNASYTPLPLADGLYYWRVRAFNTAPQQVPGAWSAARTFTVDTVPMTIAPTLTAPANNAVLPSRTVNLTWAAVTGAAKYRVQVDDDPLFGSPAASPIVSTTSASVSLRQGEYSWHVQALDAAGNEEPATWSAARTFTIQFQNQPAAAAVVNTRRPVFSWASITGAKTVVIEVASDADFNNSIYSRTLAGTSTTHTADSDLPLGDLYWRLNVDYNDGGGLIMSPFIGPSARDFTVSPAAPPAPTLLNPATASLTNDNTVPLSWSAVSYTAAAFTYEVQVDNTTTFASLEFTQPVADTPTPGITTSVLNDGLYSWRVRTVNEYGSASAWSAVRTFTVDTTPPNTVTLSAPANNAVLTTLRSALSWAATTTAKSYVLQVATDPDFNTLVVDQLFTTTRTTATLKQGRYYWRVAGIDGLSNGDPNTGSTPNWSLVRSFTLNPQMAPAANAISFSRRPTFTWGSLAGSGVTQITIEVATDANFDPGARVYSRDLPATALSHVAAEDLPLDILYWRLNFTYTNLEDSPFVGSLARKLTVSSAAPVAPKIVQPAQTPALITKSTTPTIEWTPLNESAIDAPYTVEVVIRRGTATGAIAYQESLTTDGDPLTLENTLVSDPLTPDGVYVVQARVLNQWSVAGAWSAARSFTVDTTRPLAPVPTTPAENATLAVLRTNFVWGAVTGAKKYRLQVDEDENFGSPFEKPVPSTSYTMTAADAPLAQGRVYWRVFAVDAADNETLIDNVPTRSFIVSLNKTPVNGNNFVTAAAVYRPTLAWSLAPAGVGVTGYRVQLSTEPDFSVNTHTSPDLPVTTASYVVPLDLPLDTYYWRVQTLGMTEAPLGWSFAVTPTLPPVPGLSGPATAALLRDNTPELTWNKVTYTVTPVTYEVLVDNTTTFMSPEFSEITITPDDPTPRSTTTTLGDGLYSWRVRSVNSYGGKSAWSAVRTFTIDTKAPNTPTLSLPAANATVNLVIPTLTWVAPATAARYEIRLDTINPPVRTYTSTTASLKPASALLPRTYYWQVRAFDAAGNDGLWSEVRAFTVVSPDAALPTPNRFTTATPLLTWGPITWATLYEVQVDDVSTFTSPEFSANTIPAGTTSIPTTALADGTYFWRMRVRNAAGAWGAWSRVATIIVEAE